jgi:3-oxoacyl-[acyl-carrier-protein] synthase II
MDIVITGSGIVSAVGNSVAAASDAALRGACGIRRCDDLLTGPGGDELPVRVAATVGELDVSHLVDARHLDLFSRSTLYALHAAEEAICAAGLDDPAARRGIGVVAGSAGASADLYFDLSNRVAEAGSIAPLRSGHAPHLSSHAPAALIGLTFGLHGPNLAAAAACATSNLAVVLAADQIRAGRADVMLAGATESCVGPLAMGSFVAAHAVNATDEPIGACRPFDRRRAGLVFGEGAGFLVVESAEHARQRGARPIARLLGDGLTNDAFHMWAPEPGSWANAITTAIARAGIAPDDVDYVSAHAAGTQLGDAAETQALKQALGARAHTVPISSTKGIHGHAFAASGAMELVLALDAMHRGLALPTVGLEEHADECDLTYVTDLGTPLSGSVLLKDSFGFMGTNAVLVLEVTR